MLSALAPSESIPISECSQAPFPLTVFFLSNPSPPPPPKVLLLSVEFSASLGLETWVDPEDRCQIWPLGSGPNQQLLAA